MGTLEIRKADESVSKGKLRVVFFPLAWYGHHEEPDINASRIIYLCSFSPTCTVCRFVWAQQFKSALGVEQHVYALLAFPVSGLPCSKLGTCASRKAALKACDWDRCA